MRILAHFIAITMGVAVAGCGAPVVFSAKSAIAIAGDPPGPIEPKQARVEVREDKIAIHEKIQFDVDRATIKQVSFSLLDEVAAVIKKNPRIKRIAVEGHASAEGPEQHNLLLSDRRANAVMKYLVERGIPKEMLEAKGYGISRPIADNESETGREKNRRVEFIIVDQDAVQKRVEIDPATGQERVLDQAK
jgi:OOP family OmpA-OmpF porin